MHTPAHSGTYDSATRKLLHSPPGWAVGQPDRACVPQLAKHRHYTNNHTAAPLTTVSRTRVFEKQWDFTEGAHTLVLPTVSFDNSRRGRGMRQGSKRMRDNHPISCIRRIGGWLAAVPRHFEYLTRLGIHSTPRTRTP
jgi:hypothetical protein